MSLDQFIAVAMECGALRKEIENRESAALDALPFQLPPYGPWCADYGTCRDEHPGYRDTLEQLGMRIDEHGRYWITPPPPCGHRPSERNVGRDALTCDGCR
ncbi:MAG TPA: hypothetical protein VK524_34570 [Polyangiaceae bacterium]|nr:hypothetical protein [Polyangiaceae bacterium]